MHISEPKLGALLRESQENDTTQPATSTSPMLNLYPEPQNPSEVYSNLLYRWVDVMYGEKALEKEALRNLLEYEPTYRAYQRLTGKK